MLVLWCFTSGGIILQRLAFESTIVAVIEDEVEEFRNHNNSNYIYTMEKNTYFKGCKNSVYDYFAKGCPDLLEASKENYGKTHINEKRYGKSKSDNSYSFVSPKGQERDTLNQLFDTDISEVQWNQAINGKGHEIKRILTMHSSALLSLLFFHAVSKDNPLCIQIDRKKYSFTKAVFEVQNKCLEGGNPSSIDVMLVDHQAKVVLLLESKLSEYLYCGKKKGINIKYKNQYSDVMQFGKKSKHIDMFEENNSLTLQGKDSPSHYCEGIKQMLCHFIGAMNFEESKDEKHEGLEGYNKLLGTVLLDLSSINEKKFNTYKDDYKELAEHLNGLDKDVKVIDEVITYQDLYKEAKGNGYQISKTIVKYYGLDK